MDTKQKCLAQFFCWKSQTSNKKIASWATPKLAITAQGCAREDLQKLVKRRYWGMERIIMVIMLELLCGSLFAQKKSAFCLWQNYAHSYHFQVLPKAYSSEWMQIFKKQPHLLIHDVDNAYEFSFWDRKERKIQTTTTYFSNYIHSKKNNKVFLLISKNAQAWSKLIIYDKITHKSIGIGDPLGAFGQWIGYKKHIVGNRTIYEIGFTAPDAEMQTVGSFFVEITDNDFRYTIVDLLRYNKNIASNKQNYRKKSTTESKWYYFKTKKIKIYPDGTIKQILYSGEVKLYKLD